MKTSKPLRELIPDIVDAWKRDKEQRQIDYHLFEILNNKLLPHVRASLADEIISQRSYQQTIKRIPSINLHKRVVDKTSKVYIKPPVRLTKNDRDKELMKDIIDSMELDKKLMTSNRYLNSCFRFAIEPYVDEDGAHRARVLYGHQFMPFSDSILNPDKMTVYVKYIATEKTDKGTEEDILSLTSDTEFLIIDTAKRIRTDIMSMMGIQSAINSFGFIPAVYGKTTDDMLIPFRNEEGKEMAILVPKLFADINFASKYLSHSVIWAKNVDMDQVNINADALWMLGDTTQDGADPEVGVITPQVDIPNQLNSIGSQIQNYFEGLGIKTNVNMQGSNPVSAVSKAIDEADVSDIRAEQIEKYKCIEKEFWTLMVELQKIWTRGNKVEIKKNFSSDFISTFAVVYPEMKAMQSKSQRLDEAEKEINLKISSRKQILRELHPELSEEQIEKRLKEADDEAMEDMERKMEGLPGLRPERQNDGTFQTGNQEATKVQPENNVRGNADGGSTT